MLSRDSGGPAHAGEWIRAREDRLQSFIGLGVFKIQNSRLGHHHKGSLGRLQLPRGRREGKGEQNVEDLKSYRSSVRGFFSEQSRTRVVD